MLRPVLRPGLRPLGPVVGPVVRPVGRGRRRRVYGMSGAADLHAPADVRLVRLYHASAGIGEGVDDLDFFSACILE